MNACKSFIATLAMPAVCVFAQFQEGYFWAFQSGNLVSNWSFENLTTEICGQSQPGTGGTETACRIKSDQAKTGNHILIVHAKNEGIPDVENQANLFAVSQTTRFLRVEPGAPYTFSFQLKVDWKEGISSSRPVVCWLREDKTFIGCQEGDPYLSRFPDDVLIWTQYSMNFTPSSDAQFIYFHLVQSDNDGIPDQPGDVYKFEDLMIRKTGTPGGLVETRSYADASGRTDHVILNDGAMDVVSLKEFDDMGRGSRQYLPIIRSGQYNGRVIISALNLGTELVVDFADIQSAHAAIVAQTASTPIASLPQSYAFYAIVASEGDLAPVAAAFAEIIALSSSDGVSLYIDLIGIVRNSSEYLEIVQSHPGSGVGHASGGPFTGNFEEMLAAQYPGEENLFSEIKYPVAGVNTVSSISAPGTEYGPSARLERAGSALLATSTLPANPEYNTNAGDVTAGFAYSWTRDAHGFYSAEIRGSQGQLIKSAVSRIVNPSSEEDWIVSISGYDNYGRLTTSTTPEGLETSFNYDGKGNLTSYTDPDRGTCFHLYDQNGRLRFKRTALGLGEGYFIAIQYDLLGRYQGKKKIFAPLEFTQANADNPDYPGSGGLDEGVVYDGLDPEAFEDLIGTPLASLGFSPPMRNGHGRSVFSFNRNPESSAPGISGPARELVATFKSHDMLGRISEMWKYIGPAPAGKRWHKIKYAYDEKNRLKTTLVFQDETEAQVVTKSELVYDARGRVARILDKNQEQLAGYTYDFRDRLAKVALPGNMEARFEYDIQGKIRSRSTVENPGSGEGVIFQELFGYEGKAHEDVTNPAAAPRYDGMISSRLLKFSAGNPNPVQLWQYEYDGHGRMVSSSRHAPSVGGGLDPDGSLIFPVTFSTTPEVVRDYEFDDDGSISSQSDGTTAYGYSYVDGTHRLDNVSPDLYGRPTSASGNFQYDAMGRMREDEGSEKTIDYNFVDRPVKIEVAGTFLHLYYDENDNQVAALEETQPGTVLAQTNTVYEAGLKTAKEIVVRESGHPQGATETVKYYEYGQSGLVSVAYQGQAARHVVIKDYQGNFMGAVSTASQVVDKEQGYLPYGEIDKRVETGSDLVPSGTYNGKNYQDLVGLYYFGARYFDPELGIWLTPDAYGEFNNPYGRGGDPVNFVDSDGNCEAVCWGIIIGATLGAYFGGSAANETFNPLRWDLEETWDEILVGAIIGGVAGGVGAWVGAPAIVGGEATGALGWGSTAGLIASSTAASALQNADDFVRGREPSGLSTNVGAFDINWGASNWFEWNNPLDSDPWYVNVGDGLGWVGNVYDVSYGPPAQAVQNKLLYDKFATNEQLFGNADIPSSVAKAEKIIDEEGPMWTKNGKLPESRDPSGEWCGKNKCNMFLQETTDAPKGKINQLVKNALESKKNVPLSSVRPGDSYLLRNPIFEKSGHGVLIGRNGAWLHASTAAGGAAQTVGWARVIHRWFYHFHKDAFIVRY